MGTLSAEIAALAVDQIDFKNDALEAAFEKSIAKFGSLYESAQAVDTASTSDETVVPVAKGVLTLAGLYGKTYKNLTDDQKVAVKEAVAQIVTGPNEAAIEKLFDDSVEFIASAQELNTVVDTPPEEA